MTNVIRLEPAAAFDSAIIGYNIEDNGIVYDFAKALEICQKENGVDATDAKALLITQIEKAIASSETDSEDSDVENSDADFFTENIYLIKRYTQQAPMPTEFAEDDDRSMLENRDFLNAAIIGELVHSSNNFVYSYDDLMEAFLKESPDWEYEDAIDWFSYNTLRSLPYMSKAPVFIQLADVEEVLERIENDFAMEF